MKQVFLRTCAIAALLLVGGLVKAQSQQATKGQAVATTAAPSAVDQYGVPRHVDTGNPAQDDANYRAAKEKFNKQQEKVTITSEQLEAASPEKKAYIQANPEKYNVSSNK